MINLTIAVPSLFQLLHSFCITSTECIHRPPKTATRANKLAAAIKEQTSDKLLIQHNL
jgi:hypothetical protein